MGVPVSASQGQKKRRIPGRDILGGGLLYGVTVLTLFLLVAPMIIVVITSFGSAGMLTFPPETLSLETYSRVLEMPRLLSGIRISILVAFATVVIVILLSVPAAIAIVRKRFRGKAFIMGFLQSPLMIPGIVVGIALLFSLSLMGVQLSLTTVAVGHAVVTLPFMFRVTLARMESADVTLEDAARDLGANSFQVFWHILLPYLKPGIIGGGAFTFLLSFDNVPVSIFTAPVRERPLPVELFNILIWDLDPAVSAVATLQIVIALVVLIVAARTMGVKSIMKQR